MDGFLGAVYNILTNPLMTFLIFILIIVAVALSILSFVNTFLLSKKIPSMISSKIPTTPSPELPQRVSKPTPSIPPSKTATEFIRITSGLESLEEISSALTVNSIFLFNLTGMSIESYNVKEEEKLAAALADIVATLKKSGFPTESISIRDGVQGLILFVSQIGEMEVYALLLGGPDVSVDVGEARELLKNYVSSMIKRKGE
ncbi:MAG: hypothetical protein ABDH32_07230 [Candidatus Caldarchaeales archaeon]